MSGHEISKALYGPKPKPIERQEGFENLAKRNMPEAIAEAPGPQTKTKPEIVGEKKCRVFQG